MDKIQLYIGLIKWQRIPWRCFCAILCFDICRHLLADVFDAQYIEYIDMYTLLKRLISFQILNANKIKSI